MYENSDQDSYSPFLSQASNRRASAPAFDDPASTNTHLTYSSSSNYGAVDSANPLLSRDYARTGYDARNTHARTGYDPRLPIANDTTLVPGSPNTRRPPPPKQPNHKACFIYLVVLLCLGAFAFEMRENKWKFESFDHNPMLGPSAGSLIKCGAKLDCLIEQQGEFWRIFSPMWLHAGVIHIVCNMGATLQLGVPLEKEYGWKAIAPLYMAAGIIGTLCSILFLPNSIMVGASGAVFGLLGASWAEYAMNVNGRRTIKVFCSLFAVTVLNLLIGTTPLLDNFAHTGGMIAGFFWGLFLLNKDGTAGCGGFGSLLVAMVVTVGCFVAVLAQVHLDKECSWCAYINCVPTPWWNCSLSEFYGPCAVSYVQETMQLNVTCAVGRPHLISNVTQVPDQTGINTYCNASCGTICWNGES